MKRVPAAGVVVPRWLCTFGTLLAVVAAEDADDAQAIMHGRMRARGLEPAPGEVHVRRLYVSDEERLAKIDDALAAIGGKPSRY